MTFHELTVSDKLYLQMSDKLISSFLSCLFAVGPYRCNIILDAGKNANKCMFPAEISLINSWNEMREEFDISGASPSKFWSYEIS